MFTAIWLTPIAALIVATFITRWQRKRVATSGRFVLTTESGASSMNVFPGQTITVTIQALTSANTEVPHGPVTFNDPGEPIEFSSDDTTATYHVPASAALVSRAVTASFQNSLGVTIPVSDVITIVASPDVADHGVFVWGSPTGP